MFFNFSVKSVVARQSLKRTKLLILMILWANAIFVNSSINICYDYKRNDLESKDDKLGSDPDSFPVDSFDLNIDHPAARIDAHFTNLTIWQLPATTSWIKNDQVINITYPNMTTIGNYNLTGNIGDLFDIFGDGDFWMHVYDFSVAFTILDINLNTTSLCTRVSLDVDVQQVLMEFHGLMHDDKELEDLLNKAFSTIVPEIVRDEWKNGKEASDQAIEDLINKIINFDRTLFAPFEEFVERQATERDIKPIVTIM